MVVATPTEVEIDARTIAIVPVVAVTRANPLAKAPIATMANLLGSRRALLLRRCAIAGQRTDRCCLRRHDQKS